MSKDVEFQDVVFSVEERRSIFKNGPKRNILKGVSGLFRAGELCGIMGSSGAGKSSLMNAISGFRTIDVEGSIRVDKRGGLSYITQEDIHHQFLTVAEMMKMSCDLKLKSDSNKNEIINDILAALNLEHRRNVTSKQLSGGERKRLSIALELVANPAVFFLDEPTSGLDEVSATQCIRMLRELAMQGRAVVCTIHQPSATTFALFDKIYILSRGQCIYQGSPQAVVPFLSSIQMHCPTHYNPSDYLMELCENDDDAAVEMLADIMQNGKLLCCTTSTCETVTDASTVVFKSFPMSVDFDQEKVSTAITVLQKLKAITRSIKREHVLSNFVQFIVLFKLMMLKIVRNRVALQIQLIHNVMCGVLLGLIYFNAADEGQRMFDHLKYCMGVTFFLVFTQLMVPVLCHPQEVKLIKQECYNRWYKLPPYYLALTLSRLPFQILFTTIFMILAYWMPGMPPQWWRFALFTLVGIVVSMISDSLGLAIGATFNVTNGSIVGPMIITPLLGLAVYGFDIAHRIPLATKILMKFSFIRGSIVSLVLIVFSFDRKRLTCNDIYCHFDDPKTLLRFIDIETSSLFREIMIMLGIMMFFRFLHYLSLRKRVQM